jgi:hypothetical protein
MDDLRDGAQRSAITDGVPGEVSFSVLGAVRACITERSAVGLGGLLAASESNRSGSDG